MRRSRGLIQTSLTRPSMPSNSPIRSNANLIMGNVGISGAIAGNPLLGKNSIAAGGNLNRLNAQQTGTPSSLQRAVG